MDSLNVRREGRGPTLVLSHALGCDLGMWDGVVAALSDRWTVVRFDHRNHGGSPTVQAPFSIEDMADDAAALVQSLGGGPVHFAGLSLGGMVAQSLAARHPALVKSIVVANSASYYDEAARAGWSARIDTVKAQGMQAIVDGAFARWFTPEFLNSPSAAERLDAARNTLLACDPLAYAASCAAVRDIDLRTSNAQVACPTLVLAGTRDAATPPSMSDAIQREIAGARGASIDAAHLSAIEQPAAFAQAVERFLTEVEQG